MQYDSCVISITLNGKRREFAVEPRETLLSLLRNRAHLTGTKQGCGLGECGACAVILNGRAVNSCCVFAEQCDGAEVETIEGVGTPERPHVLQQTFAELGAIQCGFCTPGMIMSAKALLEQNPSPTRNDILTALSGNLCRCTGYAKIEQAVMEAARRRAAAANERNCR